MLRRHLVPVLAGLSISALIGGVVLLYAARGFWSADIVPPVRLQFIDAALQVLVVTVIGTLSTFLADAVQKHRERETGERELRMDLLRRAVKAYADSKKIRRQLRTGVDAADVFGPLNAVQLEFESLKREAETVSIFVNQGIPAAFKCMEKYLNAIIRACEKAPHNVAWRYPFNTPGLEPLTDFTDDYEGSCFEARFAYSFDVALALMQGEILHRPAEVPSHREYGPGERRCNEGWFTFEEPAL